MQCNHIYAISIACVYVSVCVCVCYIGIFFVSCHVHLATECKKRHRDLGEIQQWNENNNNKERTSNTEMAKIATDTQSNNGNNHNENRWLFLLISVFAHHDRDARCIACTNGEPEMMWWFHIYYEYSSFFSLSLFMPCNFNEWAYYECRKIQIKTQSELTIKCIMREREKERKSTTLDKKHGAHTQWQQEKWR